MIKLKRLILILIIVAALVLPWPARAFRNEKPANVSNPTTLIAPDPPVGPSSKSKTQPPKNTKVQNAQPAVSANFRSWDIKSFIANLLRAITDLFKSP